MIATKLSYPIYWLLLDLALSSAAYSQQLPDSAFYRQSTKTFLENGSRGMGPNSLLYTGAEYLGNGQRAKGTPFYLGDSSLPGSVLYRGEWYTNIGLQYNLQSGELLVKDYSHSYDIVLTKEKVAHFLIARHEFIYLDPDRSVLDPDYYEWINPASAGGAPRLFALRGKKIRLPANAEEQAYYQESDSWFLEVNNHFYRVDGKNALLDVLKDKKDEIKKFIRENHVDFKKGFEQALIKTTDYYAQIRN